jgi:hypothetical protein
MKKNILYSATCAAILLFSGCGNGSDSATADPLELESDGKTLLFYSASTNEQYAFDVDTETTINLNNATDNDHNDISNFNMSASEQGTPYIWIDSKGDADASNDEGKVVMFSQEYSFANDGNASWEDFYYLGHYHTKKSDNNETTYYLAAHDNDEFNVTSGGKYNAMGRLNAYLQAQETIKNALLQKLPAESNGLCSFHVFLNEEGETFYYAMGSNGTMYIYDDAYGFEDSVAVSSSCEPYGVGISSTEDGVLLFLADTQKVYSIDSHEDGVYHVHNSWDLSQLIGSGKSAQMMVGLQPLKK